MAEGKQFALVLTHDVESRQGLGRCRSLMELEMQKGFHACFSFVPEGDYGKSERLFRRLNSYGFEIGVHDLHHDGNLYASREAFQAQARRLNYYLKQWNAAGGAASRQP